MGNTDLFSFSGGERGRVILGGGKKGHSWEENVSPWGDLQGSSRALFARMYLDSNRGAVNLQPYPPGGTGSSVRVQELSSVRRGFPCVFSRTFEVFDSEAL